MEMMQPNLQYFEKLKTKMYGYGVSNLQHSWSRSQSTVNNSPDVTKVAQSVLFGLAYKGLKHIPLTTGMLINKCIMFGRNFNSGVTFVRYHAPRLKNRQTAMLWFLVNHGYTCSRPSRWCSV